MKLREEILKEHSKEQCSKIVSWIGSSQERFDELFQLFLHDEYRVVQRAAWPLSNAVIAHPAFITGHFKSLLNKIKEPGQHEAVRRNGLRLLEDISIPQSWQGDFMDLCFQLLGSATEPIAVKASCISVLGNLAIRYPEIIPEFLFIVREQLPSQSPGFKARAKKVFKKLKTEL